MDDALLEVFADPTRRRIFELLAAGGPQAVTDLARHLPVSRPAVSQHLKVLQRAGVVSVRPEGRRRVYRAELAGLEKVRDWLERQWDSVLDQFEEAANRKAAAMENQEIPPIVKTRLVPIPPELAFDLFTERVAEWWPFATHSIRGTDVVGLRFEGRVGGRVVEETRDGEFAWADVLAWDPPNRFVLSWHPSEEPVAATRLEVRFSPAGDGTKVELIHSGWEEFGDRGEELRSSYNAGWETVLEPFVAVSTPDVHAGAPVD